MSLIFILQICVEVYFYESLMSCGESQEKNTHLNLLELCHSRRNLDNSIFT